MFGYALAYLFIHPQDWMGPAIMLPLSLALTIWTQWKGTAWLIQKAVFSRAIIGLVQAASLTMGVILFLLMYLMLLR